MKLVVQPESGLEAVLSALRKAKKSIDITIFRLDIKDVAEALEAAVKRGVAVRALVAHTNKGGEKLLRKFEERLLAGGVTVTRSAEEFGRYHCKLIIVDGAKLHVNGFNFTWLDVERSRSFGVVTKSAPIVKEAVKLFQADTDRQPYSPASTRLVVSPENSRVRLTAFIQGARRQLLIYDPNANDGPLLRLLAAKKTAGLDVRIIGKLTGAPTLKAEKCPVKHLHVRAIVRDGRQAFIGSQSLRPRELDKRREVGIIIKEPKVVRGILDVFEADWAKAANNRKTSEGDGETTALSTSSGSRKKARGNGSRSRGASPRASGTTKSANRFVA
jgi:phosphatidylserine/phosphatidylglycerophosphate/cardiolipin synthase-like enzyme